MTKFEILLLELVVEYCFGGTCFKKQLLWIHVVMRSFDTYLVELLKRKGLNGRTGHVNGEEIRAMPAPHRHHSVHAATWDTYLHACTHTHI